MPMQIVIQPIAWSSSESEYNSSIFTSLIQHLSKVFRDIASINNTSLQSSSLQSRASTTPPIYLFNKDRKQWISSRILDWLLQTNNPDNNTKILAICNFD